MRCVGQALIVGMALSGIMAQIGCGTRRPVPAAVAVSEAVAVLLVPR